MLMFVLVARLSINRPIGKSDRVILCHSSNVPFSFYKFDNISKKESLKNIYCNIKFKKSKSKIGRASSGVEKHIFTTDCGKVKYLAQTVVI